jgi:hypothetical protein
LSLVEQESIRDYVVLNCFPSSLVKNTHPFLQTVESDFKKVAGLCIKVKRCVKQLGFF